MWPCSEGHISDPMRGYLFQTITFIGLTASQVEKGELSLQLEKAFLTTMQTSLLLLQ
jgi:hypothetical protein